MSDILIENSEGVTTVTLNRLARKNAITASMYAESRLRRQTNRLGESHVGYLD